MRQPTGIDRTIALGMLGAGALVGIGAPAASAATTGPATTPTTAQAYQASIYQAPIYRVEWSHLGKIKLYPLAGSAVDPLSNTMGTDLGGLPVSTAPVSAMFADGLPMRDLPLVGGVLAQPASANPATDADDEAQPAPNPAAGPAGVIIPAGPIQGLTPAAAPPGRQAGPLQ